MSRPELSMEVRLALAAHVTLQDRTVPVTQLCREQGISRQAYYEYRARFLGGGVEGLLPRSRRPLRSPGATSADVIELVVAKHDALAAEGWDAGARSVRNWLVLEGVTGLPSWRTIHKYLAGHGRTRPTPSKRPRSSYKRFRAKRPNGMWQIDGLKWRLADRTRVVPVDQAGVLWTGPTYDLQVAPPWPHSDRFRGRMAADAALLYKTAVSALTWTYE